MATSSFTNAPAFKAAFKTAIESVVDTSTVLVSYGHPGPGFDNWDDWVSVAALRAAQESGPLGTSRPRNEDIALTVWIGCYRAGGPEAEQEASDAAYAILQAIDHYTRQTDTTVGGTVWWCFLATHESNGVTPDELLEHGRTIEIEATFTARARITGA